MLLWPPVPGPGAPLMAGPVGGPESTPEGEGEATDDELMPLDFATDSLVIGYRAGIKASLGAVDAACASVLTAVVALATAYGAVLTLVTPKNGTTEGYSIIPFFFLGASAALCMWAQSAGIEFADDNKISTVRSKIEGIIGKKRNYLRLAIASLALALAVAGATVTLRYGKASSGAEKKPANITLSPVTHQALQQACKNAPNPIRATVDPDQLKAAQIEVVLKCLRDKQSFSLPAESVLLVQFVSPS